MAVWTAVLKLLPGNTAVVFLSLLLSGLCVYAAISHVRNRRKLPLPPKPRGLPVLGNTIDFVRAAKKNEIHLLLQKWAEQYGEIMRVQVGPMTSYYLNSDQAVKVSARRHFVVSVEDRQTDALSYRQALFDKSSAQTSERPRWIVSNEQLCNKWNVLLLPASDARWKVSRPTNDEHRQALKKNNSFSGSWSTPK